MEGVQDVITLVSSHWRSSQIAPLERVTSCVTDRLLQAAIGHRSRRTFKRLGRDHSAVGRSIRAMTPVDVLA